MDAIILSQNIGEGTLQITNAGLSGAVALRFMLSDGPLAFTLTDLEARVLITQITQQLAADEAAS